MKTFTAIGVLALTLITAGTTATFAAPPSSSGQASITLTNSDAQYCYAHNNTWDIDKTVTGNTIADGMGTVTWTVTATKDSLAAATFSVHGGLTVTNTGSAPATIGNIVINLQRPNSPKKGGNASHVSIAADIANATDGNTATSAKIVAQGSQENAATNFAWNTNKSNYAVSGAMGTFTRTACSGKLEFKDASDNSIFSIAPPPVIPVGDSITLLYDAEFDTSCLPPAGTTLRVEALVSFGNAGVRGGGGATASNIDVNGNGTLDLDEAQVRTVPARNAMAALPANPEETNDSVTITDPGITAMGTVTTSNPQGFDQFPLTTSATDSWQVSIDVVGGTEGGRVCNEAALAGEAVGGELTVIVQSDTGVPAYDSLGNQIGWYATFECVAAATDTASKCVDVGSVPQGFQDGDFCTYSKGGYAESGKGRPDQLMLDNFKTVFASGLTIGFVDAASGPYHHATWTGTPTGLNTIRTYLSGGGSSGALTTDTQNASSGAGGTLAKQTTTLALNIGFEGVSGGTDLGNFGNLTLCNTGTSLDGQTVNQILGAANTALGTGSLPSGYTFGTLNTLIDNLNQSFHNCKVTSFATANLCR